MKRSNTYVTVELLGDAYLFLKYIVSEVWVTEWPPI